MPASTSFCLLIYHVLNCTWRYNALTHTPFGSMWKKTRHVGGWTKVAWPIFDCNPTLTRIWGQASLIIMSSMFSSRYIERNLILIDPFGDCSYRKTKTDELIMRFNRVDCIESVPANTIHWHNAGFMLARRHRRRPNITPALGQCIVFGVGDWVKGLAGWGWKMLYLAGFSSIFRGIQR